MSLKSAIKTSIAFSWDAVQRWVPGPPQLTILYYHAVPDALAAAFDAQMAFLKRTANVVAPDSAGPLDRKRPNVAVTFDDAFASIYRNALPSLVRHGIPATVFVPTGWMGRQPGWSMETSSDADEVVMTADEITGLSRDVITIGSHTVRHPHLTSLTPAQVKEELTESRESLERLLKVHVDTLAFPYGDHDEAVVAQARMAGYRHVYTVAPQAIREGDTSICRGRTAADPGDSLSLFALKTRGGFAWMPLASRLKRVFAKPRS